METFRHTLFARLSMLLLLVTLHVDAFAEACGASHPASLFETAEPCAAAVLSEGEDSVASSGLELVEEQDFAEGPEGRACLPVACPAADAPAAR